MTVETLWSGGGTFSGRDEVVLVRDEKAWKAFVLSRDDRPSPGPVQLALATTPVDFSTDAVVVVFATRNLKTGDGLAADGVSRRGTEVLVRAHADPGQVPPILNGGEGGSQTRWLVLRVPKALVDGATSARAEFGGQAVAMNAGSKPVLA